MMEMISLFFRNLFFTIIQPGIVVGVIPFWILNDKVNSFLVQQINFYHYMGVIFFVIGLVVMLICIINFAIQGRGTLSPADPPKKLVVSGLYKFSRNPMYVGVIMILIGESIFLQSNILWIYTFGIFIAFNVFIIFFEEPRLLKKFGVKYADYSKKVRRWV